MQVADSVDAARVITKQTQPAAFMTRPAHWLIALGTVALLMLVPAGAAAAKDRAVVTVATVNVGAEGNPSVAIVPFTDAIYQSCADAPQTDRGCQTVGEVDYRYGIGRLEITVRQWVAFLNTVDPTGRDRHNLYSSSESSTEWPRFGQINMRPKARPGHHYRVAFPAWANKPYGFANFLRAARFANSLGNGRTVAKRAVNVGGHRVVKRKIMLSRQTERGMYNMRRPNTTRTKKTGFVVPSQDEWIKAAYYDPSGGGTFSYWKYPTNAGVFGDGDATAPTQTTLNAANGNVTNASTQPLATFHASGQDAPAWCPAGVRLASDCSTVNPFGFDADNYAKAYQGSLGTVGQAKTTSPWGTLDQGGNAVEWTDTITPPPLGKTKGRVWRRMHGGVPNAPSYQLWLSAIGLQPQDNVGFTATYPWLGIRIGMINRGK